MSAGGTSLSDLAPGVRAVIVLLLALGLVIGVRDLSRSWFFPLERQQLDLRVLYCGGRAANDGANPYALEPIRTCEHAYPTRALAESPNLALPFTLPGYDLPPVELLARLPLDTASAVFVACSVTALALGIVFVARALGVGLVATTAALALSIGFPSLPIGQLAPFELLALGATGWALAAGRDRLAGVLAATTLFEPHVGAFVVIAVVVLAPRARPTLLAGCAVLAATALLCSTPARQLAYLTTFLPGQAYGDLHSPQEYGLSYALTLVRIPDAAALLAGTLWTVLMLAVAIPLARACAARGMRAAFAFVPAACAVAGGTYMHVTQEAFAVPAALLLVRIAPTRLAAAFAGASLVLLAVPWPFPAGTKQLLVLSLVCVGVVTWFAAAGSVRSVLAAVAVSWLALLQAENHLPSAIAIPSVAKYPASTPIGVEYRDAILQQARFEPYDLLVKLPTWCGLLALLGAAALTSAEQSNRRYEVVGVRKLSRS
jgi:hypothetical protein